LEETGNSLNTIVMLPDVDSPIFVSVHPAPITEPAVFHLN